ncbi:Transmembrane efflux protein [Streptomyces venezuelae]|uniref:MFS transporter n=1 Tax=Streptomyces gardneri TaxID=66892 RepID=UPI0006BD89D3|nr:MFS transporter [Streptomyces gardneri]ALO06928.1 Transmembrane efflux protein [Streptomyces venezuelae]QPK44303.1 MFS transporter [Streptomyces gardneri]WRK35593.1 MFS transporter [Streptomyces venezuelae]CUM42774.1 putative transmembrane efflux protein [Streptomyces venezuelae]
MPLALLALAVGAFGIGTTEFVIMGLLPEIAADYGVTIPTAGLLVTGYALGVVVGAPLLTVLGTKVSRKRMLMLLMGLFVLGNVLSAVAPSFGMMLTGRVVASLAHGAFFGIGSVVAAELVAPDKKAGAIATMFTGLTVANIVGVPLGTFVGQAVGWRTTFAIVAALGVVGLFGIARLIPDTPRPEGARLRRELTAFRNPQVLLAMAMTVLGFGGVFAAITYIAPMMTQVAGFSEGSVTWLLVLFGIGMFLGNLIGGRYADRALMPLLYTTLGGLAVVLALFTVLAHHKVLAAIAILLVGALGFATVPPLQKRVLDQAHAAPTLASAVNIGAFNLGNALAAWLGGLVIASGFGYTSPNWVGAVLAAAALGLAFWSAALERRAPVAAAATAAPAPAETPVARTPAHH